MRTARAVAVLLASAAVACTPCAADARSCKAPPGTAAIAQYCESLPTSSASNGPGAPVDGPGGSASSGGSGGTSPSTAARLKSAGPDGAAVLGLAGGQRERGARTKQAGGAHAPQGVDATAQAPASPSQSPLRAVAASADHGSTVGGALIWALVGGAVLVAGVGWVAHRRRSAD